MESIYYFPLQNAAIEKLTGYSLVELQDKKVWDFQGMASDQILNENDEVSRTLLQGRVFYSAEMMFLLL